MYNCRLAALQRSGSENWKKRLGGKPPILLKQDAPAIKVKEVGSVLKVKERGPVMRVKEVCRPNILLIFSIRYVYCQLKLRNHKLKYL